MKKKTKDNGHDDTIRRRSCELDMARLAAETCVSMSTVRRWWRFDPINAGLDYALRAASEKLRIRRRDTAA